MCYLQSICILNIYILLSVHVQWEQRRLRWKSRPSSGPIAPHTSAHAHALCLFFNRILVVFCFAFDLVFFVFCIFHLYNVHIYEYFCFIFHIVHFSFMFYFLFHCFCYLFYLPRHPGDCCFLHCFWFSVFCFLYISFI